MKHRNNNSSNFHAFLKTKSHSSAHVFPILVKIFHHHCACDIGANMACIEICVLSAGYHQNVPCMHMFEKYLIQIEMIISVVMSPCEYDQVFITILLILVTLEDKFLPIERNIQFCTLFHWHLVQNLLMELVKLTSIFYLTATGKLRS